MTDDLLTKDLSKDLSDDELDKAIDEAVDAALAIDSCPYLIEEDPDLIQKIFRIWSLDAGELSNLLHHVGVHDTTIAILHEHCCQIYDQATDSKTGES